MAKKKDDPFAYLEELIAAPRPQDPYKSLATSLPVKVSSSASAKDLLSKIGTVQSNRAILKSLGAIEEEKTSPGIVSALLNPEKGLLFAPARFGSAFVADVTGLGERTDKASELSGNPIESAIRAARGEFAITGGDILRTSDRDNLITRGGKLLGALAWDLTTDPTSYLGPVSSLSRKGLVETAANPEVMKGVIKAAEQSVAQRGLSKSVSDRFVKDLLTLDRKFTDGTYILLESGRGRNAQYRVVRSLDSVPVADDEVLQMAANNLSELVSSGLVTNGRVGILENLKEVFNTKTTPDLAEELFESALPKALAGGLYLVNPITGKRYKKIIGGKGGSNLASVALNKARFEAARGTRGLTKFAGGEYGGAWADAMRDLHKDIVRTKGNHRSLITDYVNLKNIMQRKAALVGDFSAPALNWAKQTAAVATEMEETVSAKAAKTFRERVALYTHEAQEYSAEQIDDILKAPVPALRSGEYADHMAKVWGVKGAQVFMQYAKELAAAGIPISVQKRYLPLMYTQEAMEYLMAAEPRQGKDLRGLYSAEKPRVTFETPQTAEEIAALFEDDAVREFATPMAANKAARVILNPKTGKQIKWFEDDVAVLMGRYGSWAANRIATERTVKALEFTGVVRRYIPETIEQVNATNAEVWLDTARTLDAASRQKLKDLVDAADKRMREMTDQSYLDDENRKRAEVLAGAQKVYDKAIDEEMNTYKELVQLEKFLRDNDILDADILDNLLNGIPDYDRAILENVLRDIKRAQTKAAKRHKVLDDLVSDYSVAKKQRAAARRKITQAKTQKGIDPKTGKPKVVRIPKALKESLEDAEERVSDVEYAILDAELQYIQAADTVTSLAADRNAIRQAIASADAERVAKAQEIIGPYLAAMDRRVLLVIKLQTDRQARQAARAARNAARIDVINLNAKGVSVAIDAYVKHRTNFKNYAFSLRNIKRETWTLEQKRQYGYRLKLMRKARSNLVKAIGYSAGGRQTAGREYARELMRLIGDKTDGQIQLMRFFAQDDTIDQFVARVMSMTDDAATRATAMRDLMRAYSYLRKVVTNEDLEKLGSLERNLFLRKGKARPLDVFVGPPTARVSILMDDLKRAKLRGDKAEVKRLNAALKHIKSMTDKKGFSLVGGGEAGFSAPRGLRDLYAASGTREIMEEMWRMRETPDEFTRYLRDFYDPLAFLWKTQATVGRGFGYIFNNLIGGSMNNYLYGVTMRDNKEAGAILGAFLEARSRVAVQEGVEDFNKAVAEEYSKILANLKIGKHDAELILTEFVRSGSTFSTETVTTLQDLARTGLTTKVDEAGLGRLGITFDWQREARSTTEESFRKVVDTLLTWPYQRLMNDLAQRSEMFVRLAAFIRGYKDFGNAQSALAVVQALHFDYKDLSNAEQWVKRFVPFYTWNRNNIPLQLRALFFQPDKIKRLVLVNENFKKAFGADEEDSWIQELMPEWVDTQGGFLSRFSFMDNPIGLFPRLPLYDIDKVTQVVNFNGFPILVPRMNQFGSMLGPAVTPIEYMVGVNFDTGIKYSSEGEKWSRMLTNAFPLVGTAQRYGRAATVPLSLAGMDLPDIIGQERGMTDLLNLTVGSAAGYSAFTYTEKQMMSGLMDKIDQQNEQIKQVAAEANIDLEWLRSQIKQGKTLFEIKLLLAQGKGNADMWAAIRELEGFNEPSRDYAAVFRGLRSGDPLTGYSSPS